MNAESQAVDTIVSTTVTMGARLAEKSLEGGIRLSAKLLSIFAKGSVLLAALIASQIQKNVLRGGEVSIKALKKIDQTPSSCMLPRDKLGEFNSLAKQYGVPYHIVVDKANPNAPYGIVFPYSMSQLVNTILTDHLRLNELPRTEPAQERDMQTPHREAALDADAGFSEPAIMPHAQDFVIGTDGTVEMRPGGFAVEQGAPEAQRVFSVREELRQMASGPRDQQKALPPKRESVRALLKEIQAQKLLPSKAPRQKQKEGFAL